jgi:hypothetical protein
VKPTGAEKRDKTKDKKKGKRNSNKKQTEKGEKAYGKVECY